MYRVQTLESMSQSGTTKINGLIGSRTLLRLLRLCRVRSIVREQRIITRILV